MIWVLAALAAAAVAGVLAARRRYTVVRVEGDSMEPALRDGARVLVRRVRLGRVRLGQLVVFAFPPDPPGLPAIADETPWLVKRVVALPGCPVPRAEVPALREVPEQVVPPGRFVVLGDNRIRSYDSRRAGYFAADGLLGVVVRTMGN